MILLVATQSDVLVIDPGRGTATPGDGLDGRRPTCLAADPHVEGRAWCGTEGGEGGAVLVSEDAGASWRPAGLEDQRITAVAASPTDEDVLWAGTEPSQMWHSKDGGDTWERSPGLERLPSSSEWSFPPRPDTHHVRWIAPHPREAGRLWVAIEAGALVSTPDGGRTWRDRVPGGPWDTHELAIHPDAPDTLRISAGDGYFESHDGGATWASPRAGLEVGYLRSVAIDPGRPDVVVVSAASHAHRAYMAGAADGRLYRREGESAWERVRDGWPDPPDTIAPLLVAGNAAGDAGKGKGPSSVAPGEIWAADERGVHRSEDGGSSWTLVAAFAEIPRNLRGLALISAG